MQRQNSKEKVPPERGEAQSKHWSHIGINAVAAASIYCDHGETRRDASAKKLVARFDETDLATD